MTAKIRTWGGIGDVLLMTPALREIKRQHPGSRVNVYCTHQSHMDVLKHNPHVDVLKLEGRWRRFLAAEANAVLGWAQRETKRSPRAEALLKRATGIVWPRYGDCVPTLLGLHATEIIGQLLNVAVRDRRLEIFLTRKEHEQAQATMKCYRNPVAIQITSRCSRNQHWPIDRWELLTEKNPRYTFLQLGLPDEPAVRGAIDLRGKTSLREAIALLAHATAFVGVVSSLAHATNATGTPAVVLVGPSAPEVWAHPNQRLVARGLRCAPCIDTLQHHPCPYGAPCLSEITVEDVEDALSAQTAGRLTHGGNGHVD
jgi:ADP-heptose:LPS heptosyltransferase